MTAVRASLFCCLAVAALLPRPGGGFTTQHPPRAHPTAPAWGQPQQRQSRSQDRDTAPGIARSALGIFGAFSAAGRRDAQPQESLQSGLRAVSPANDGFDVGRILSETESAIKAADDLIRNRPESLINRRRQRDPSPRGTRNVRSDTFDLAAPPRCDADDPAPSNKDHELLLPAAVGGAIVGWMVGGGLADPVLDQDILPPMFGLTFGGAVYFGSNRLDDSPRGALLTVLGLPVQAVGNAARTGVQNAAETIVASTRARIDALVQDVRAFPSRTVQAAQQSTAAFVQNTVEEIEATPQRIADSAVRRLEETAEELKLVPQRTSEAASGWFQTVKADARRAPARFLSSTRQKLSSFLAGRQRDSSTQRVSRRPAPPDVPPPIGLL